MARVPGSVAFLRALIGLAVSNCGVTTTFGEQAEKQRGLKTACKLLANAAVRPMNGAASGKKGDG